MPERDVIETRGKYRAVIELDYHDDGFANPRQHDNVGIMWAPHRDYLLGDHEHDLCDALTRHAENGATLRVIERWLRIFHGATAVLRLGLIDHSGISMYVGGGAHFADPGGWDSGTVGLYFDTAETREATGVTDTEAALRAEVEEYDKYLRGDVWIVFIERLTVWTSDAGERRETWDVVEMTGGYLGQEWAEEAARGELAGHDAEEVTS